MTKRSNKYMFMGRASYIISAALMIAALVTNLLPPHVVSAGDKYYVCKYVGTPGVNETLQTGQNPILVSENALPSPIVIGGYFNDSQGRSFVLGLGPTDPEPTRDDCPPPTPPGTASISQGLCTWNESSGSLIGVTITVNNALFTFNGVDYDEGTSSFNVAPGSYSWSWVADSGYTGSGSGTLVVVGCAPAMDPLQKTPSPTTYSAVGQSISYTYVVRNGGEVTLTGVTVTDDKATVSCPKSTLAVGESMTCTASYSITQGDLNAGSVTNHAMAVSDQTGPNYDDATVNAVQNPGLSIEKTASPVAYDAVGDVIGYSYLVTNSGNVTLSGPFTVNDDKATDESCPATASLAPGASITCTASYTITQADLDATTVTNIASATNGDVTSPTDTETVTGGQIPSLSIVKTATPATYDSVGDVIGYSYLVTNNGNVTLTGPFTVYDDKATNESCPATATLAPLASITCTASYTITQAHIDTGSVTNIAYAANSQATSPTDTETVTALQNPGLGIVKTATPATYDSVGDVVGYSYLVTNNGNVTLSGPFTVSDDKAADESCPATATLAPLASITCTASYTITQVDLDNGSVTNIASASNGEVTSLTDTETVTAVQTSALSIVKTALPIAYDAVGNVISYSYLVTNSGNITLSGPFTVNDDKAADESCPLTASLAPGASITCTASYTITQADMDAGTVTNIASATNGDVTSPTDTETVTAGQIPSLSIVKTATPVTYDSVGNVITYSFVVTNNGNVTIDGPFTIDDDKATDESCPATATLAPLATITCTASYTITQADIDAGSVTNIASASNGEVTSPTDTETVQLKINPPPVPGCMDKNALNYNPLATVDDGSCLYGGGAGVLIPVTGVDMGMLGRTLPGTLFGLSFSFAGLGLVFTGLARRRDD